MKDFYPNIPAPAFILEETLLRRNLEKLSMVSKEAGISIILALKGYALWKSFPMVKQYLAGATASSLNEAKLCVDYMGSKAHTFAPVYAPNEIEEIAQCSSHLTFNSLSQFNAYKDVCKKHNVSIGLRVNPGYSDVTTEMYNPCSPNSRLGIPAKELKHGLPEGVDGIHFHALCENDSYSLERVLASFEENFGHLIDSVKWVNMGGGHLITHKDYKPEHAISLLKTFKEKYHVDVILEPGGAVGWQTGVLKAQVLDIVNYGENPTAILNVSFAAHMPDTLEMPYRPNIRDAFSEKTEHCYAYRIGGNSCLAGDFMMPYYFTTELNVGDTIILEDMMHYTMVKTTTFNGVQHPAIWIQHENGENECIRTFTYADFRDRLS